MPKLFGTDGIRSKANIFPMDPESVLKIAKLCAIRFKDSGDNVVIGKDTRCSGYVFESCFIAGLLSFGMNATLVGPIPTPAVGMLTKSLRCAFGVMISASHNEFSDNGLKFFQNSGLKFTKQDQAFIEKNFNKALNNTQTKFGKAIRLGDAYGRYIECVKRSFPEDLSLKGIKIVLDCANGSAYNLAEKVFWELGADVITINNRPDGYNINLNCGALYPGQMQQKVRDVCADIGIAVDGDCDRLVICDAKGNVIDGDQVIASIAKLFLEQNRLNKKSVVITEACSLMLERFLRELGIKIIKTDVGDKNVTDAMIKTGANLGGETSGHIIMSDYSNTSDALAAALQILYLMKVREKPLEDLVRNFTPLPKLSMNIQVGNLDFTQKIRIARQYATENAKTDEKILIRKSGTEKVIRIVAEGQNDTRIKNFVDHITEIISSQ